jgi:hypothetical protein
MELTLHCWPEKLILLHGLVTSWPERRGEDRTGSKHYFLEEGVGKRYDIF